MKEDRVPASGARPGWLLRIERAMRPLDYLPRGVALGAGAAMGAGAGMALGWSGELWTLAAGATLLGGAWWLVASAEPVAVVEHRVRAVPPPPAEPPPLPAAEPPPPPRLSDALGMVELPGGRFWMGSAEGDPWAYPDEHPRHAVEVAAFSMASYAVTQKLYRKVTGSDPGSPKRDALPANNVSWFDAIAFCNRLSEREGLAPAYVVEGESVTWQEEADGYRLPTEAEWEYACRAGTETAYSYGNAQARLGDFAWYAQNAYGPQPVGRKQPNPWGLHDMHGNMWEWCWDSLERYPYKGPTLTAPAGGGRVARGGSFVFVPRHLRSARRFECPPVGRKWDFGFRCVRGPRRQP
jgi:formylglycine-generating enzyme required for sulfatase activity